MYKQSIALNLGSPRYPPPPAEEQAPLGLERRCGHLHPPAPSPNHLLTTGQVCRTVNVGGRDGSLRTSQWLAPTGLVRFWGTRIGELFQIRATYMRAASILARCHVLRNHQRGGARCKKMEALGHMCVAQEIMREFLFESPFSIESGIGGESGTRTLPLLRPPPAMYLYGIYTLADFPSQLGHFQDSLPLARMQTKIIPAAPCPLSIPAGILCPLSEKTFSLSDNGQSRTMRKRIANNCPANCCALASRQLAKRPMPVKP